MPNLLDDRVYRQVLADLKRVNGEAQRPQERRQGRPLAVQLYHQLRQQASEAFDVGRYEKCTAYFRAAKAIKAAYA